MKQVNRLMVVLLLGAPGSALASAEDGQSFEWWVDTRGSLTAAVPDLEHPDDPGREAGALGRFPTLNGGSTAGAPGLSSNLSPFIGRAGAVLGAPPQRLSMDDRLVGDLAWTPTFLLAGGLQTELPSQGTAELLVGLGLGLGGLTGNLQLRDQGTRLRLGWPIRSSRLVLDLYPLGGDRLGPAEGHSTAWGEGIELGWRNAPVIQLAHLGGWHELFLGLRGTLLDKTVIDGTEPSIERRASYQLFLGGALRLGEGVRLHLGLGHSLLPGTFAREPVRGAPLGTRGFSLGGEWSSEGLAPGRGERLPLFAESALTDTFFAAPPAGGGPWWSLRAEWSWLQQRLEDPERPGLILWQPAWSLGVVARGGLAAWSFEAGYLDEGAAFVLREQPGLMPLEAFASGVAPRDGHRGWVGVGHAFLGQRLQVGLDLGVRQSASVTMPVVSVGPDPLLGERTILLRRTGETWVLPEGAEPVPEIDARAELLWRINGAFVLGAQLFVRQNGNRVELQESPTGETTAAFVDPFSVGLNLALRFRFAADSAGPTPPEV